MNFNCSSQLHPMPVRIDSHRVNLHLIGFTTTYLTRGERLNTRKLGKTAICEGWAVGWKIGNAFMRYQSWKLVRMTHHVFQAMCCWPIYHIERYLLALSS